MKALTILTALIATSQAASYFYDDAGRLTQVAYEQGSGIRYAYDPSDNLTSVESIPLPIAPTDLSVERSNPSQATLTWKDASSNETGFLIMRRSARDYDWQTLATLAANQSIYTDHSVSASENYVYRVLAQGAEGRSAHSNESAAAGEGSEKFTIRDTRLTDEANRLEFWKWSNEEGVCRYSTCGCHFLSSHETVTLDTLHCVRLSWTW